MRAAAGLLEQRKEEIFDWLIHETGGTVAKAELEWSQVHAVLLESASMPHHVEGTIEPSDVPDKENRVYRRPVGTDASAASASSGWVTRRIRRPSSDR